MPRASSLEAKILDNYPKAEVTLVRGGGGVFDVAVGDELVYSKHQTGRFPKESEIVSALAQSAHAET